MRLRGCGWNLTGMKVSSRSRRPAVKRSGPARSPGSDRRIRATKPVEIRAQPPHRLDLDTISTRWQLALDAAHRALGAAGGSIPASEIAERSRELSRERAQTAEALVRLAETIGVRPTPWLSPIPMSSRMLGLPPSVRACLFDLDGALTDSADPHACARGPAIDEIPPRPRETGRSHLTPTVP